MRRGFLAVLAEYLHRRFDNVFQHGAMGPQVETLEHHAQARAQTFDLTRIGDLRETASPSLARIEMPLSTW